MRANCGGQPCGSRRHGLRSPRGAGGTGCRTRGLDLPNGGRTQPPQSRSPFLADPSTVGGERRVERANHPGQRVAISHKHWHGLIPLRPGPEAEAMAGGRRWVWLGHGRTEHQGKGPGQHWGEMCTKQGHSGRGQACPRMADRVWGWSRRREPQSWSRGQRDPEPWCPLGWRR